MRRLTIAALFIAALPAAASAASDLSSSLRALSPDSFQSKTAVLDDPLESNVIFSTEKAHREGWKLFKPTGHDNHLVAQVDRQTGQAQFQVKHALRYYGTPRDYHAANYVADGAVRQVPLSEARHGNDVCPMTENMLECSLSKYMAFTLSEQDVRAIAAQYQPGAANSWGFKMKDRTGHDIVSAIAPAEAAGLLRAVDQYRASTNRS
ncbi:MAG TPA: hypothetical protein VF503_10635 [Sphingobium sp.]|uniref:hypothetical protein n=1 Tax=Sphingobium sp. TaxID=1912891 RepID=UPI002ED392B1